MIEVFVDGRPVSVKEHFSVYQACAAAGVDIPRFCYHERLSIAGNCRMCLVEVNRAPKPVASCAFPISPGLQIFTDTPKVKKAREGVMEFLLSNHPLDCPVCDQGGECDLQDQALIYGHDRGRFNKDKRAVQDKQLGPLIKTIMTRCIHCTRCIRFADQVAGTPVLGTTGRGSAMEVGTYIQNTINSEISGNIIDLCPVGALTSKPYSFHARPWELISTESIDVTDALGANIRLDARGGQVQRILPRLNESINQEWITDKTRFSYDALHVQRITKPYANVTLSNGSVAKKPITWDQAAVMLQQLVQNEQQNIIGHAGKLIDAESLLAIKIFFQNHLKNNNFFIGKFNSDTQKLNVNVDINKIFLNSTLDDLEKQKVIIFVGSNPRLEAPLLNSRLISKVQNGSLKVYVVADLGYKTDLTYSYTKLPNNIQSVLQLAKKYQNQEGVKFIFSSNLYNQPVIQDVYKLIPSLNNYGFLHYAASHPAALALDYSYKALSNESSTVFFFGSDEDEKPLVQPKFSVYFGHHGNSLAQQADLILPIAAFTETNSTFINTLGIAQQTQIALTKPAEATEIWKVFSTLFNTGPHNKSQAFDMLKQHIPYCNDLYVDVHNSTFVPQSNVTVPENISLSNFAFTPVIDNFYMTDPITRASKTMANCAKAFV